MLAAGLLGAVVAARGLGASEFGRITLVWSVVGHFRPPAEVGTYGAALRLAQVLEEIRDPLYFAAFPQLARAWVEARGEFVRLLRRMAAGLAVLTTAVVGLGVAGAPLVVALVLGPDYAAAAEPFRLLLLATGVAVATLWATPAMLGSGQPAVATAAATSGAVCLAVVLFALVPTWGITGAAWARVGGALGYLVVVVPWLARIARRLEAAVSLRARRSGRARHRSIGSP